MSYETILYSLLFLFPLFATVARHWVSSIFVLIALLGLVYHISRKDEYKRNLHVYDKIYIWLLAVYFSIYLLSILSNYPIELKIIRFDIELRFLIAISIYYLLLKYDKTLKYLVYGSLLSLVIALLFCVVDLYYKEEIIFTGAYSQLFTGPVVIISLSLVITNYLNNLKKTKNIKHRLGLLSLVALLFAISSFIIISTNARVAYIGLIVLAFMSIFFYGNGVWKYGLLIICVTSVLVIFTFSSSVNQRVTTAFSDISTYLDISETDTKDHPINYSSIGARLEMWKTVPLFISDHTFFGVGNGNYQSEMKKYVDNGKANSAVLVGSHAHNVFVNTIITKGITGLSIVMLLFIYPLYIYIKTFKICRDTAVVGIIHTCMLFIISMNESAPFWKANFVAVNIIFSLVIFQSHIGNLKNEIKGQC